jgi:hypothetical protein
MARRVCGKSSRLEQDENVEANGKMHGVGVSASGSVAKKVKLTVVARAREWFAFSEKLRCGMDMFAILLLPGS